MKRTALTIVLVVLGLSALVVVAQVEPLDFQQAPGGQQSNAAPPVRPVEVVNFPDPQNVAGTVDIGNLPPVQAIDGNVVVSNFPTTHSVTGTVTVDNLPTDESGNLLVASTGPSSVTINLVTGSVFLDEHNSWVSDPFVVEPFSRIYLAPNASGGNLECRIDRQYEEGGDFLLGSLAGVNPESAIDVIAPTYRVACGVVYISSTVTLYDFYVFMRR